MYLYTWLGIQHSIMYEYNTLCYTMISEGCGTLFSNNIQYSTVYVFVHVVR